MWKLIKMDFYRLFSSKAIKVGAVMACLVCAAYMLGTLGIIELAKFAFKDEPEAVFGLELVIPQVAWMNGANFADIVFSATASLALFIGCMISANFIGAEQSCGYTKNFAGQLPNKGYMAVSKLVVTSVVQIIVFAIYVVVSSVLACTLLGQYINGYAIGTLMAALGLRLALHLAINAIIIFLCTLTKSHAIAMVAGCIFGIGVTKFAYLAVDVVLSTMKINFSITNYMPDGINSQLAIDTVSGLCVKAILVSIAFIAVFLAANYYVLQKRDVK